MAAPPSALSLSFNAASAAKIDVQFEPLFQSIRPSGSGPFALAGEANWYIMSPASSTDELNAWDLSHRLLRQGFGIAGVPGPQFAEPDLQQQWITGTPAQQAFAMTRTCDQPAPPDSRLPAEPDFFWFRDKDHSQLELARTAIGQPADRIRIAHLDTGYDPTHETLPHHLRTDLQHNFVNDKDPGDATDDSTGIFNNLGHGTGTLGLLAGAEVDGVPLGGAPFLDVVPLRVANRVVLFENSAIAQAFDYVHALTTAGVNPVHVITMSMGGLASQSWADAVNALYDLGVFMVTAAGNNFGNLPTHNIVYPARFKRVVAACGVMANNKPYADLPLNIMAGNYGPASKMDTAVSGFSPNTSWAKFGCAKIVDHDGSGTSSATPQVAAAAALWLQQYKTEVAQYPENWMRVEAVRKALFDSASLPDPGLRARLGRGAVQANAALSRKPAAAADLQKQPVDVASFPFLRVITGLGITAIPDTKLRMLELEALQLTQRSQELERLLPDPDVPLDLISPADRQRIIDALISTPGASATLRYTLGQHSTSQVAVAAVSTPTPASVDLDRLKRAMDPAQPLPPARQLRVFAFDPLLGTNLDTLGLNQTTLQICWEKDLKPGPVGEYLEVVDIDPVTGCAYASVDLNHPLPLSQQGLAPSEANPQFHQQMVYTVAMKTIEHFERALGRVALWAPRIVKRNGKTSSFYVPRLRIYPHAMREANSFYSPDKKALLLGYLQSQSTPGQDVLPGGTVFCCLSHDIVAHETTHALLDGLHRYFQAPSNPDVLAFHEAFADIVALFQHFTIPEALRHQIRKTRGDLGKENMLGQLAQQFGEAMGGYGALRDALGGFNDQGEWVPATPSADDYRNIMEPHARGAILVASVFDAFVNIYRNRSQDLIRLATNGTGVLPPGDIPYDLVNRLAYEASKSAGHVLDMCIRALDYCPPVDITFGDYLRALVTADKDLIPDDKLGYRVAFIQAFRRRGIYPRAVRNLSAETLCWESPEVNFDLEPILRKMTLGWDLHVDRAKAWKASKSNAYMFHEWLKSEQVKDEDCLALGFYRNLPENGQLTVSDVVGKLSPFEVHSVRPVRRVGPDGQQRLDLVVEITQGWNPLAPPSSRYRGGCTLLIDLGKLAIRYVVRKRVGHPDRVGEQTAFQMAMTDASLRSVYFDDPGGGREPFAMLHRTV
jgi:hypothetical protein